ncbi:MAG: hypothetical protein RRB13_14620 [bacterium]|nr:hypothetical protein [bacterium]
MTEFEKRGEELRSAAKRLVLEFMLANEDCKAGREGIRQAKIFRACGFDFGDLPKANSTQQQYYVVAILHALEAEGKVEQIEAQGPWRLK